LAEIRAHHAGLYRTIPSNDAVEPRQHDKAIADIDRLIEPGQIVAANGIHPNTGEMSLAVKQLARELHRTSIRYAPNHGLADENRIPFRIEMHTKMLPVREVNSMTVQRYGVLGNDPHSVGDPDLQGHMVRRGLRPQPLRQVERAAFFRIAGTYREQFTVHDGADSITAF